MGYHRHILIKFDDGNTRILRGVEAACPEEILKELEWRWRSGYEMWVFDSVNRHWILIPKGEPLPPPPLKVHLRRNGEALAVAEGITGGKRGKVVVGVGFNQHNHLHGDAGDEDIYKILGNQRPPANKKPLSGRRSMGDPNSNGLGRPGWMAGAESGAQEGSPIASGYKSSYQSFFPQDPNVPAGAVPQNPNNPHYPPAAVDPSNPKVFAPAMNPNNPGYRNNPDYTPFKNHGLLQPRRNHWVERDLRKDRQPVLPWGDEDPTLHNSSAGGGDNMDVRRMKMERDRNLAVFQHQAGFRRQVL